MKRVLVPFICVAAIFALHSVARYQIASLFLAPVVLSILFATALPLPALLLGIIVLLFEVFSSVPQGGMLLTFLIPLATRRIRAWSTPDATWTFFTYVGGTVFLQLVALVAISRIGIPLSFSTIPFSIFLLQLLTTSISAFVFSLICHELRSRP